MPKKQRLDILLVERNLAPSRSKAAAMIMAAEVRVDGRLIDKPGTRLRADAAIQLKEKPRYVGRGGIKLEAALEAFALQPAGKICADVGASTGGFTDCLLQRGAARVYAIDVGSGILHFRLRQDERVCVLENTNARHLPALPEQPALVVADVSFISLRLILPAIRRWLGAAADVVTLVKPQFEAGRADVGKGGIVRDRAIHRRVLAEIVKSAEAQGFGAVDVMRSPIKGAKGNEEYLLWLRLGGDTRAAAGLSEKIVTLTASNQ